MISLTATAPFIPYLAGQNSAVTVPTVTEVPVESDVYVYSFTQASSIGVVEATIRGLKSELASVLERASRADTRMDDLAYDEVFDFPIHNSRQITVKVINLGPQKLTTSIPVDEIESLLLLD